MKTFLSVILVAFLLTACNYQPVKEHSEEIKKQVEKDQQKTK
ncbi:hypothetical protein ACFPYJ_14530 [Paenibacillus solisilvae]|uniref:Lipoprotein n=1 Tax=Paenibacillus solisilvae TaxID=2486751 RepID=A0ABW0VZP4_9BACL